MLKLTLTYSETGDNTGLQSFLLRQLFFVKFFFAETSKREFSF